MVQTGRFFIAVLLTGTAAFAFDLTLDRRAIDQAIALGHSRIDAERVRFHLPYRVTVGRPPVDYVDVVTPFRRIEIEAETKARNGNRTLSQREAVELLAAAPEQVDFYIELTFHPLNTYIGVPAYEIRLVGEGGAPVFEPRTVDRFPRYGPRVESLRLPSSTATAVLPGATLPMLGGTAVARFDARPLNPQGRYELVIGEMGKEIGRARIDFRALR